MKRRTGYALAAAGLLAAVAVLGGGVSRLAAEDKPAGSTVFIDKPGADGFVSIFNGKDLTGWEGLPEYWEVKDGVIHGHETKDKSKQTFLVYKDMVKDFELRYSFKFGEVNGKVEGNSGVQFRSKLVDPKTFKVGGYQADSDADNKYTGIIYDEANIAGGRGIMSKRGEKTHYTADGDPKKPQTEKLAKSDAELKQSIKMGDWNDCVLTVKGNHITYQINGNTTTDLTDDSPKALTEGVLALQLHAGFTMDIQFKDLKMKKLE
ncbi:MAG: Cytochrome c [Phycisphaerales bacterium]|nr:Cytochrome c [Phycisphaerales bacterium]